MSEPVAWGMLDSEGGIYDSISPEEHDREEGAYTIPLYTHPSDRIAELEKQIENLKWDVNHREQDVDNLKTKLFDAKRKYDTSTHEYKYSAKYVKELEAKIAELAQSNPLYTHPAKELDEQFKKGFEAGKEEGWKAHKFHHPAKTLIDDDVKYNVTIKWDGKTTHHENVSLGTPLHYNEPKTLTDEEIEELAEYHGIDSLYETGRLDFARAILRKAQEK